MFLMFSCFVNIYKFGLVYIVEFVLVRLKESYVSVAPCSASLIHIILGKNDFKKFLMLPQVQKEELTMAKIQS